MSKQLSVVKVLQGMNENEFTQKIVKPYFETLGYEWTQFNGGPYEKGVDLFAFKKHEVTDELMVVCIQSKVIKPEEQTKPKAELSQLINQLRQCLTDEQVMPNGEKQVAKEAYLAIAGELHPRLRSEIYSQLDLFGHRVVVLETPKLIELLQKKAPHVLESLDQHPSEIAKRKDFLSGNTALNNALYSKSDTNLTDIYSDLEFFVGKRKERAVIVSGFEELQRPLKISGADIKWFVNAKSLLLKKTGAALFTVDISALLDKYERQLLEYSSASVQKLINARDKNFQTLKESISLFREKVADALYAKSITVAAQKSLLDAAKNWDKFREFREMPIELVQMSGTTTVVNTIKTKLIDLKAISEKIPKRPELELQLSKEFVSCELNSKAEVYLELLQEISRGYGDKSKVREFLNIAQELLSIQAILFASNSPLIRILDLTKFAKKFNKISFPPSLIFDSGVDIALFGGAGFGKTTTLQSYAARCQQYHDNGCVFVELAKYKESFKLFLPKKEPEVSDEKLGSKKSKGKKSRSAVDSELFLKAILHAFDYEPDKTNVEELQELLKTHVLILDGIDEVYGYVPTLLRVIKSFKKENPRTQLIISSRDNVEYLSEIDFIGISLLPFTEKKLKSFIYSWLGDDELAHKLWKKIQNKDMLETVSNPLLATIACALTKEGVEVPSTGSELYVKRIELFTGLYDQHRNIKRTQSPPEFLTEIAKQTAFLFHEKEVRSMDMAEACSTLATILSTKYKPEKVERALKELISPCNVILRDERSNKISFGHLRFQESLVAQVLDIKQRYELLSYLPKTFWRGAFTLLAESNAVEGILDECLRTDEYSDSFEETLGAMISNSPVSKDKKAGYRELLEMLKGSSAQLFEYEY